jgi:hypothetical protein
LARVQEKFQRHLATQVRNRKERFIEFMQEAVASIGGPKAVNLTRDDLNQVIEGFTSVVTEALQGRSNEIRTFWVETVVPGMVRKGIAPNNIVQAMKTWVKSVQEMLQNDLGAIPDRKEAAQWMGSFFNEFISDVERSARTAGGAK